MEFDADLGPAVADQLQHVGFFGALSGGFDDDLQAAPVRQQTDAAVVAFAQADLVEQGIGLIQVELGPGAAVLLTIKRTARQDGVVSLYGQAEEDHLIDLVPVDREGQCPAEPHVAEQRAIDFVVDVEVGEERDPCPSCGAPQVHTLILPLLGGLEEGVVVEPEVTGLKIAGPRPYLGRYDAAAGDVDDRLIDVRQLAAFRVDPVKIGVALEHEALGRRLGGVHPRLQGR